MRIQRLATALWAGLRRLLRHTGVNKLIARAENIVKHWPGDAEIAWNSHSNLPSRILLGGHLWPHEIPGKGWHPADIDRMHRNMQHQPTEDRARALQSMLLCSSDRMVLQSTCELWLRCVHDTRLVCRTAKAKWRLAQLLAPGMAQLTSRAQHEVMRAHFSKRIPQYASELFATQRELKLAEQHSTPESAPLVGSDTPWLSMIETQAANDRHAGTAILPLRLGDA